MVKDKFYSTEYLAKSDEMAEKIIDSKEFKKIINGKSPSQKIYIFVAFLEDHVQIAKKETLGLIALFPKRTWDVRLFDYGIFIER